MKKLVLTLLVLGLSYTNYAQDSDDSQNIITTRRANWQESFSKAQELAAKQNKPLLVFFTGSDWCGPCKMLHEDFFETEEFIELSDRGLILYEADFPRRTDLISDEKKQKNKEIKKKFKIRGFPTIVILDAKGNEIERRVGYSFMRDPQPHFEMIKKIINK